MWRESRTMRDRGRRSRLRLTLPVVAAVLAGLLVMGCGSDGEGSGGGGGGASGKPLKVGVVLPYTGPFGFYGPTIEQVMTGRFAAGAKQGGPKVDLMTADDQTDPKTALTKVRKFVQQDQVDAVVCCINGAATLAVAPYLNSMKVPQIAPIPGPAGLEKFDNAFSVGHAPNQLTVPFGRYAVEKLEHKTAAILSTDFVQGRLVSDGFKKGFTEAGGKIVGEVYPPLDTADYGAFLSKLPEADMVFSFVAGADAVRMVKQFDAAGLKKRTQLIGFGPLVTRLLLDQIGEAAVGVQAVFHYAEDGVKNQANTQFTKAIEGRAPAKVSPNFVQANAFTTASVIATALQNSPGARKEKLVDALAQVKLEAPWGPFAFSPETHYPQIDGYHYEVVKGPKRLEHKILGRVQGVDAAGRGGS